MRKIQLIIFLIISAFSYGQQDSIVDTVFVNVNGETVDYDGAFFYQIIKESQDSIHVSQFYMSNAKSFEGHVKSYANPILMKNNLIGNCIWYYKNGTQKANRTFNSKGQEVNTSKYFFENEKLKKTIDFSEKGNQSGSVYTEYEDGIPIQVYHEKFENRNGIWDLYTSEMSEAKLVEDKLYLQSFSERGTSRYIYKPIKSNGFSIQATFSPVGSKNTPTIYGLMYNYKDWNNYDYFVIHDGYYTVGSIQNGVDNSKAYKFHLRGYKYGKENTLLLRVYGSAVKYSVNGEDLFEINDYVQNNTNLGVIIGGNSKIYIDDFIVREYNSKATSTSIKNISSTGTGFLFSNNGYMFTNHHVIEDADNIFVEFTQGPFTKVKYYSADVVITDEYGDLAILKISDPNFNYEFISPIKLDINVNDPGTEVFALGYPYSMSGMGSEIKFTDGKISAKSGYNGNVNQYQTTVPVQPGNSGSPLFNSKGQLIGCLNSKITDAENVSYATKAAYLLNLIQSHSENIEIPETNGVVDLTLEDKIKKLSSYIAILKIE